MKALNRKERLQMKWTIGALFVPMILITAAGATVHFRILSLQVGDLEAKEAHYQNIFEAQAKKGFVMDQVIRNLGILEDSNLTVGKHQATQATINSHLRELAAIDPVRQDTSGPHLDRLPPLYDSLASDVKIIQGLRDSIITSNVGIGFQKLQMQECMDAWDRKVEQKKKAGK
ncbi:MAG: hypothetical protein RLZZ165_1141 [Bacteroidota bacterium]